MYHLILKGNVVSRMAKLKAYKYGDGGWRAAFKAGYVTGGAPPYNPAKPHYGFTHCRWVENVGRAGLRFVGYVRENRHYHGDDIFGDKPSLGWYTDNDQFQAISPVVYQLPARDGKPRYVFGYRDADNESAAFLCFDHCDDKQDAQRWACSLTKAAAEDAREENTEWRAEERVAELQDEVVASRKYLIDLCRDARAERACLQGKPTLLDTIRDKVRDELRSIYSAREKISTLRGEPWRIEEGGY